MVKTLDLALVMGFQDEAKKGLQKFAKSLGITKAQLGAISAASIVAARSFSKFAVESVRESIEFQAQMAEVSAMLSDQTNDFLPALTDAVSRMSKEYGESTETLARGLYDILSASIDAAKSTDVLTVAVEAATAGITDTGIAADAITTILNSYTLEAEQAADVSDLLFSIVKRGKTTFPELAASIGNVAASAASTGLSLEDMGAALATITRGGIDAATATTSLNSLLLAFVKKSSTEATDAAKELGIELNKEFLQTEGLIGVMKRLAHATDNQKSTIFGNIRALKGLNAIAQQSEGFMKDLEIMTNRAGATQEAFDKITNTTRFQLNRFNSAIKALKVSIGDELNPALFGLLKFLNDKILPTIERFAPILVSSMIDPIRGLIKIIKGSIDSFKLFSLGIGGVISAMKGNFKQAVTTFSKLNKLVESYVGEHKKSQAEIIRAARQANEKIISANLKASKESRAIALQDAQIKQEIEERQTANAIANAFEKTEGERAIAEEWMEYQVEIDEISLERERAFLEQQLALIRAHSDGKLKSKRKELELIKKLADNEKAIEKEKHMTIQGGFMAMLKDTDEAQTNWYKRFKKMRDEFTSATAEGFSFMMKNIGNGWGVLAKGMEMIGMRMMNVVIDMIARIAAEWVIGHGIMVAATLAWKGVSILANAAVGAAAAAASAFAAIPFPFNIAAAAGAAIAAMALIKGFFADGVRGFAGGVAMVGERGPELVNLPGGSDVLNNAETRNVLSGSGGGTGKVINLNISFSNNQFTGDMDETTDMITNKIFEELQLEAGV